MVGDMLVYDQIANSKVIISSLFVSILLLLGTIEPRVSFSQQMTITPNGNLNNNKVVILTFGDAIRLV